MHPCEAGLLFTCEHGGSRVPKHLEPLFVGQSRRLASHRGWDPGALPIAQEMARSMRAPLISSTTTRLLVDLNRSPENPRVFSDVTRSLARDQRASLLSNYHAPHWIKVREAIESTPGRTIHIAVHSFTPILEGARRAFSIGLLYDPKRSPETDFAASWQRALRQRLGSSRVRRNSPYRGDSDGLTTALRKIYPAPRYLGIELEVNQASIRKAPAQKAMGALLTLSLREAIDECGLLDPPLQGLE